METRVHQRTHGCIKDHCNRDQVDSTNDFSLLIFASSLAWNTNAAWGQEKTHCHSVGPISPRTVLGTGPAGGPLSPLMTSSSLYCMVHPAGTWIGQAQTKPISTSHGIAVSAYDVLIRAYAMPRYIVAVQERHLTKTIRYRTQQQQKYRH